MNRVYLAETFNDFISDPFNFSVVSGYMTLEGSWCEPQKHTEYSSLDAAMDACNRDANCKMFYNLQSKNQSYIICGSSYTIRHSNGPPSTLYKKCKNRTLNLSVIFTNL